MTAALISCQYLALLILLTSASLLGEGVLTCISQLACEGKSFSSFVRQLCVTIYELRLHSLCPFHVVFAIPSLLIAACSLHTFYLFYHHFNRGDSHQAKTEIFTVWFEESW